MCPCRIGAWSGLEHGLDGAWLASRGLVCLTPHAPNVRPCNTPHALLHFLFLSYPALTECPCLLSLVRRVFLSVSVVSLVCPVLFLSVLSIFSFFCLCVCLSVHLSVSVCSVCVCDRLEKNSKQRDQSLRKANQENLWSKLEAIMTSKSLVMCGVCGVCGAMFLPPPFSLLPPPPSPSSTTPSPNTHTTTTTTTCQFPNEKGVLVFRKTVQTSWNLL